MKAKTIKRIILVVLAGVLALGGGIAVYAATAGAADYTVTFNASAGTFTFGDNVAMATVDEVSYPNLFRIEGAMPGDSYEWDITVAVTNMGTNTVKMYVTTGDYNADYGKLLLSGRQDSPTLTATFDTNNTIPTNLLARISTPANASRIATFESYAENDDYGVYLGQFSGADASRTIHMRFAIPNEAGNEYANLNAGVHWVFTAEVIPEEVPTPTDDEGDIVIIGDEEVPLSDLEFVEVGSMTIPTMILTEEDLALIAGSIESGIPLTGFEQISIFFETRDHFAYLIGYEEDGLIHPTGNVTRAGVATILFRCMKSNIRNYFWSSVNPFSDVPSTAWYNNEISTLWRAGVLYGYEDGSFRPDAPITRAEFTAVIGRFLSLTNSMFAGYPDIGGHWAEELIRSVSGYGYMQGYEDGTFRPNGNLTRSEAALIMNNVLDRHADVEHLHENMVVWQDNMDTTMWYYVEMQEASNSHDYLKLGSAFETWTDCYDPPDWLALEAEWERARSAPVTETYTSVEGGGGA